MCLDQLQELQAMALLHSMDQKGFPPSVICTSEAFKIEQPVDTHSLAVACSDLTVLVGVESLVWLKS